MKQEDFSGLEKNMGELKDRQQDSVQAKPQDEAPAKVSTGKKGKSKSTVKSDNGDALIKKRWCYLLAFGIPFVAYVVMLAVAGVYPFGDQCVLHVDMYHQYCPFFTEFLDKLQSGDSLLYSFNIGLGSDFVALYAYYLASPLNWLLLIWPSAYVIEFMTLVIVLKVAGCGLTMFYYLENHYGIKEERGGHRLTVIAPVLVFSTAYAFSGYIAAYYWDVMWLDCVMLFPLIALGLEKLVKENKPALYFVTLAISILSNYYISIIICIFLFFYFLVLYLETKSANLKTFGRFILYSVLAGGTGAVLLLPEIKILSYSGSSYSGMPEAIEWYFSLISELTRSFTMAETYTSTSHWPNLYAGSFTLLLVILYFLNHEIPLYKRIIRVAAIAFFWISFSNNYLDFIWHGLHFPSSLPARQSFLYIFIVLVLGYGAIRNLSGTRVWEVGVGAAVWLVVIGLSYVYGDAEGVSDKAIILTGLLVAAYALLIMLIKTSDSGMQRKLSAFFCVIAMVEVIANMAATGIYTISRTAYVSKVDDYDTLLELAAEQSDGEFYRVEDTERKTKSDSALYGYSSSTTFSSLMNLSVSELYQSVRMEGGKNFYCYNGATPLWTGILSVKYVITDWVTADNDLMTLVGQSGSYYLYENNYYVPLGFIVPSGLSDLWNNSSSDKVGNLTGLASLMWASADMLSL
ncbi:MAG: YfhO family protein, partial [Clostridiales bacterium]|nr:YfhO family protein [Clostridiales bacterium]